MRLFALFLLPFVMLAVVSQTAVATVEGPPAGSMLLTAGSFIVSGANLVAMTLSDGSTGLGVLGVALGTSLAVYAPIADTHDDWGVFVFIGVTTALLGVADIGVARGWWHDPELLGMRIAPATSISDGQRWYGIQLVSD